jgi:hypothetical protein
MKALLDALADEARRRSRRSRCSSGRPRQAAALPLVRVAKDEPAPVDPTAPRTMGSMTTTLDLENRIAALVAAGRLGDPRVVPEVLPLARHDEVGLREAAVFTLAGVADARATAALITSLADHRPSVAALACAGLAAGADPRGQRAALAVDRQRDDLVRATCAVGFARAGAAAVPWLVGAVTDNAGETQRLAAYALGQVGDGRGAEPLCACLARAGQDRATSCGAGPAGRRRGDPAGGLDEYRCAPASSTSWRGRARCRATCRGDALGRRADRPRGRSDACWPRSAPTTPRSARCSTSIAARAARSAS